MRLELTGRQIDITPGLRRLVDGKLQRLERLLNDSAVSAQVVLSREKTGVRADISLHARDERFMHSVGRGNSWQAAVGQGMNKLSQQAQKVKGKGQQRKRQAVRTPPLDGAAAAGAVAKRGLRPRVPTVLEGARQRVEPLTVTEASKQLGAKDRVLVFRNADTMELSVLYRAGGSLVLVETDA